MSAVIDVTETKDVNICMVKADKRARFNASVWQAIANAERYHDEHNLGIVEVSNENDTTIVMSWRNWRRIKQMLREMQEEIHQLKGGVA